jgi:hypothetical protein
MNRRISRRTPHRGAVAIFVLGVLSACSGHSSTGDNPPPSTATVSTSPSASPSATPLKGEITAAVQSYYETYTAAVADPGNATKVARLVDLYTASNPARENARKRMAAFAASHTAGRPGPNGYYIIESVADPSGSPDGPVTSRVCAYDDSVLYDSHQRAPDGKEIIVNDTPEGGISDFTWSLQGPKWLLTSTTVIDSWEGQNKCPARSSS